MTAKYDGKYETDFDLIMSESDKPKTLYTRQVIFKADMSNYGTTPNVSYFVDSIIHDSVEETPKEIQTGEYEFTFIILDDETKAANASDRKTIYDVRHNGRSIGKSGKWAEIVSDLINVSASKSAFEINKSFRQNSGLSQTYSFASWSNTSGENLTASYDNIKNNIISNLNSTSPIIFTAQLTKHGKAVYNRMVCFESADDVNGQGTKVSYFVDGSGNRMDSYELKFVVEENFDTSNTEVKDVRLNGESIGENSTLWSTTVNNVFSGNSPFRIEEGYSPVSVSWLNTSNDINDTFNYEHIAINIISDLSKTSTIVFKAQLNQTQNP